MLANWPYWIPVIVLAIVILKSGRDVFDSSRSVSHRPGGGCLVSVILIVILGIYLYYTKEILFPGR